MIKINKNIPISNVNIKVQYKCNIALLYNHVLLIRSV